VKQVAPSPPAANTNHSSAVDALVPILPAPSLSESSRNNEYVTLTQVFSQSTCQKQDIAYFWTKHVGSPGRSPSCVQG